MRPGIPQAAHRPVNRIEEWKELADGQPEVCYTDWILAWNERAAVRPSLYRSTAMVQELKSPQPFLVVTSDAPWLYGLCCGVGCAIVWVVL